MPERRQVIVDSGPLIAFLLAPEPRHRWVVEQFRRLPAPFITCEPVLTETFHLARRAGADPRVFFSLFASGLVSVEFDLMRELNAVSTLAMKYRNIPMSLADACLVRMAELYPGAEVFTLDSDFQIYRKHGRHRIPLLMPS